MTTTTFTDDTGNNDGTLIVASWLNDVDFLTYNVFNGPTTVGADGTFWVSNGTNYVEESGATARASLGLTIGTNVQAYDADLAALAGFNTWSTNVQATGLPGIDTGTLFIYQAAGAYNKTSLRVQKEASYTGGTPGVTGNTIWAYTHTTAGVANYEWTVLGELHNDSTAGQHTAGYFQGNKQSTGPTWGAVAEAIDTTGTANPTTGLVGLEVDVRANGTDSNASRVGVHIVGSKYNSGGAAVEIAEAVRVDSGSNPNTIFLKGLNFYTGSVVTTGIDFSDATITNIFDLSAAQKLTAATNLGLGSGDSPQVTGIELGHATDTTLTRASTGDVNIEGNIIYRANGTDVPVTDGGTGRSTSTTAYGLIAAGTTATGAHQTLPLGGTAEILVGGGAGTLPIWTTATGTGAPVRETSPTLVTPTLGVASATSIALGAGDALNTYIHAGTFTPEFADADSAGNVASGTFTGSYIKTGRLVHCAIKGVNINTAGMTTTNILRIRALPFTVRANFNGGNTAPALDSWTFTTTPILLLAANTTISYLIQNITTAAFNYTLVSAISTGVSC